MAVDRLLPTQEARDLLELVREIADKELAPRVEEHERAETYPEGLFATLGAAGLLGLPYPEEWGGGGQPYEVYLQVLEELAIRWAAVAVAVSVQGLACHPLAAFGTPEQQERWLPADAGGRAARRVLAVGAAGRVGRGGADLQGRADRRRATGSPAPRRGSPTAGKSTSTRCSPAPARAAAGSPASSRPATPTACRSAGRRRRWGCTRSRRSPRTGTAR